MENEGKKKAWQESSEGNNDSTSLKVEQQLFIYHLDWFPITTSPWIASFSFLFYLLFLIHFVDFYSIILMQVHPGSSSLTLISTFITADIGPISYVLNFVISVLIMLSCFYSRNDQEGFKYILGWLGSRMFPVLRYMLEINLAVAGFFLTKNIYSSAFFFLAAIIYIFVTFISHNYTLRKDYLCCKSMEFLILFKIIIVLAYTIDCVGYYVVEDSTVIFLCLVAVHFLFSVVLVIAYLAFGYYMYRHTVPMVLQVTIVCLYTSLSGGCLYDEVLNVVEGVYQENRGLICSGVFFVFLALFFYSVWGKIKNKGTNRNQPFKRRVYFTYYKFDNASEDICDDCEIRGIIRHHLKNPCTNMNCYSNDPSRCYYDSKKNKICFPEKLNQGKASFLKFYVKCLYEEELEYDQWKTAGLILEYIQFIYMKLKNVYKVAFLLKNLDGKFLTPYEKLRLCRIKRVMTEENQHLNEELYQGNLDIENVINSEGKFDQIRTQLNAVLERNLQFWNYVERNQINLSEMANIMKPNFLLIDKINENWKALAKYFDIQKLWKFYFVLYTLYIKNQKIKPQFLEYFGHSIHEDEIFIFQPLHIDKTSETEKLYNSKILFDTNTCCLHVCPNIDRLTIKKTSRYFKRMFGFSQNQINQSSLNIMVPECIQKFHQTAFQKWAGTGKSNNQVTYSVKKVFPQDKEGYILPIYKFYKQFICQNRELQYVALLKKNKEDENVVLLNDNYEMEGITMALAKKWRLSHQIYKSIVGINFLVLFPGLMEHTKLKENKKMRQVQEIKTTLNERQDKSFDDPRRKRSLISPGKSSMKVSIYEDSEQILDAYRAKKKALEDEEEESWIPKCLHQMLEIVSNKKTIRQISVEVDLKQRVVNCDNNFKFYELYVLESEQVKKDQIEVSEQNILKEDNVLEEVSIKEEDFSKFFENSYNSQKISLSFTDNIFIKEENNYPVEMIEHVKSITVSVRIIFICFFALVLGSLFYEYNNYTTHHENILKMHSLVNFHLDSLILDNEYYSVVDGRGDTTSLKTTTQALLKLKIDEHFRKSLLDKTINEPKFYTSYNDQQQKYDQIDLVEKMFQNMIDIGFSKDGVITEETTAFIEYESLILPSANTLLSESEQNLHAKFNETEELTNLRNYVFYGIGSILLIISFILVLNNLVRISTSFQSLMEIFTQFSDGDLKKIKKYCLSIARLMISLGEKYQKLQESEGQQHHQAQYSHNMKEMLDNTDENFINSTYSRDFKEGQDPNKADENAKVNLNKKVKKVEVGKQLKNIKVKSIVVVILFLIIYGTTSFGLNIYISHTVSLIITFQDAGFEIFQYYSLMDLELLIIKERHLLEEDFSLKRYALQQKLIEEMKLVKQIDEESFPLAVTFPSKYNTILFDSFCTKYPGVLDNDDDQLTQCAEVAENNVQHGVQSFLFYLVENTEKYLESTSYDLDEELVENLEMGLDICNIYLKDLLDTWKSQFTQEVLAMSENIIIICSCLIVFHGIVYVLLIQIMIVGNLEACFLFFRKIYEGLMPDFIVTKEKIIKAKLIVEGIIKK